MFPILQDHADDHSDKLVILKADCDKLQQECWKDVVNDGQSKSLPFIKGYAAGKHVSNVFGFDKDGLDASQQIIELIIINIMIKLNNYKLLFKII